MNEQFTFSRNISYILLSINWFTFRLEYLMVNFILSLIHKINFVQHLISKKAWNRRQIFFLYCKHIHMIVFEVLTEILLSNFEVLIVVFPFQLQISIFSLTLYFLVILNFTDFLSLSFLKDYLIKLVSQLLSFY